MTGILICAACVLLLMAAAAYSLRGKGSLMSPTQFITTRGGQVRMITRANRRFLSRVFLGYALMFLCFALALGLGLAWIRWLGWAVCLVTSAYAMVAGIRRDHQTPPWSR